MRSQAATVPAGVLLLALLTACGGTLAGGSAASVPAATPSAAPSTTAPTSASTSAPSAEPVGGAFLPDPQRSPGAVNPDVTQANIHSTICVSGWTATVRPASSYTTALKERQLASGYANNGDTNTADYEEDHLISLEIGGSPTSELNLWPEPYNITDGARTKDKIENKLHDLVCAGSISLAAAQRAIAANWLTAYDTYVGATTSPSTASSEPTPAAGPVQKSAPPAVSGAPAGATAMCNDGSYSSAAHHQGECSHHGGVKIFYS